jgi:hypothetical protein
MNKKYWAPKQDKLKVGDEVFSHKGDRVPIMAGVITAKLPRGMWKVKWENGHENGYNHALILMLKKSRA